MTNKMRNYLRNRSESIPKWLAEFDSNSQFSVQDFVSSRVVFYPGSDTDWHAVELFGSTHAAHSFVYADYGITQAQVEEALDHPAHQFRGYTTLRRLPVRERQLTPRGWTPHVLPTDIVGYRVPARMNQPYGFVEILQRQPEFDDNHGAARLAILFLGADGVATYDALFCQDQCPPLYAALIQDHGYGGNYTNFGRDGLMEAIALRTGYFPHFIVCPEGSEWANFNQIPGLQADVGGVHRHARHLYERS